MRRQIECDAMHAERIRNIADERIVVGIHHLHVRAARQIQPMCARIDRQIVPPALGAELRAMRDAVVRRNNCSGDYRDWESKEKAHASLPEVGRSRSWHR